MLDQPDLMPNAPMNRWIQGILLFDFELIHVPATKFKAPDSLSRRRPTEEELEEEGSSDYDDSWLDNIALLAVLDSREEYQGNKYRKVYAEEEESEELDDRQEQRIRDIDRALRLTVMPRRTLSKQERLRFLKDVSRHFIHEGKLYRREKNGTELRVIIEPETRMQVMMQAHDQLGHRGEYSVFELVSKRFTWPKLRKYIHDFIASCHECQIRSTKRMQLPPTISAPVGIFQKVYIDVMVMDLSKGFNFIVAAKDDLTGTTEARPIRRNNSKALARFFWEQLYCRYGAMELAVTDNGSEVKKAFATLVRRMGIPQVQISPYNKHANGVVERGHFVLREAIIKSCEKTPTGQAKNWPDYVSLAVFADRVTVNKVTGYSPYYLLHGMEPILPFDLTEATFLVRGYKPGMSTSDLLALRIRQLAKREEDLAMAAETLRKARLASKKVFEKRFFARLIRSEHKPGTLVLIRNMNERRSKSEPRYFGPYQVVRRTKGGSYVLAEMDGAEFTDRMAAFRLIPYITRVGSTLRHLTDMEIEPVGTSSDTDLTEIEDWELKSE